VSQAPIKPLIQRRAFRDLRGDIGAVDPVEHIRVEVVVRHPPHQLLREQDVLVGGNDELSACPPEVLPKVVDRG
jgi:hypothetical protein